METVAEFAALQAEELLLRIVERRIHALTPSILQYPCRHWPSGYGRALLGSWGWYWCRWGWYWCRWGPRSSRCVIRRRGARGGEVKRHSALDVDQLLAPENLVERDCTESILDVGQFVGKWGPFEKGDPPTDRLILDERPEQTGVPVVGRAAKENPLTVDVRQIMSESRYAKSALTEHCRTVGGLPLTFSSEHSLPLPAST